MLETLAANGHAWINVHVRTILGHAKQIIDAYAGREHLYISAQGTALLVDQLLLESGLDHSDVMRSAGASIARTIRDLRNARSSPGSYETIGSSRYRKTVARIYEAYLNHLRSHDILDDAGVFEKALSVLESIETTRSVSTVIILDEVELSEASLEFVRALQRTAESVYRIGWNHSHAETPANVAKSRLSDWPQPQGGLATGADMGVNGAYRESGRRATVKSLEPAARVDVASAIGAENEVRAVFRQIAREGIRLDQIELAYTANEPYLAIVRALADRYDIPVTIAAGVPALSTRIGQSVRQFLLWIVGGCDSHHLAEMIRGGYVELGRSSGPGTAISRNTVEMLTSVRIRKGSEAYLHIIETMIASVSHSNESWFEWRGKLDAEELTEIKVALEPLLKLAQLRKVCTVLEVSECVEEFLSRFAGRRPDSDPSPENSGQDADVGAENFDSLVVKDLTTRLKQLASVISGRLPLYVIASRIQEMLGDAFVRARAAKPGALHVVPLSSAGYNGRTRLYVVGLDELTMGRSSGEDPLMTDSDREQLTQTTGNHIVLSSDAARVRSWSFSRAIDRTRGDITLIYSRYDVAADRALYPSSIILQAQKTSDTSNPDTRPESWIGAVDAGGGGSLLDLSDAFLAAIGRIAEDDVKRHYAWIQRGQDAVVRRAGATWTAYDGLLDIDGAGLNPFREGGRLSASRLETMAACPFRYFIRYVLHVDVPDTVSDEEWLSPLERGRLVHHVFASFMDERIRLGEPVQAEHQRTLEDAFQAELDRLQEVREISNPVEYDAQRRELFAMASAFIADERERQQQVKPFAVEFEFGSSPSSKKPRTDRTGDVVLDFDGLKMNMTGRIDRIDRLDSGGMSITDYKTGGSRRYDPGDLLNKGRSLQWALYAYAAQEILGEPVIRSGYLFPGSADMGRRIEADPSLVRAEISDDLRQQARLTEAAAFVPSPENQGVCSYCGYRTICGDIPELERNVGEKLGWTTPPDPHFQAFEHWRYAKKKLGAAS